MRVREHVCGSSLSVLKRMLLCVMKRYNSFHTIIRVCLPVRIKEETKRFKSRTYFKIASDMSRIPKEFEYRYNVHPHRIENVQRRQN